MTDSKIISQDILDSVVDTLADKGWIVDRSIFSAEDIARLREACLADWEQGRFHEAAVGKGTQQDRRSEIRSDSVLWLEPGRGGDAVQLYFDRLDQVRQAVNRSLYLGLEDLESHFAVYPRGAFYKKHLDRFRNDDARTLTAVLYLNQDWPEDAGGEMRLYLDDTCVRHLDVRPEAGTLVLFLSDRFWHEVLPAGHQRLSVTGWFRRRLGDLSW